MPRKRHKPAEIVARLRQVDVLVSQGKSVADAVRAIGVTEVTSFNARLRDELLNGEIFYSLAEARIVIESWRRHYNTMRPHGSLGSKPPAPEVFVPAIAARAAAQSRPASPPALASRPSAH
jgi:transposase InsO family protein